MSLPKRLEDLIGMMVTQAIDTCAREMTIAEGRLRNQAAAKGTFNSGGRIVAEIDANIEGWTRAFDAVTAEVFEVLAKSQVKSEADLADAATYLKERVDRVANGVRQKLKDRFRREGASGPNPEALEGRVDRDVSRWATDQKRRIAITAGRAGLGAL